MSLDARLGAFDPNADYSGKYHFAFKFAEEFGIPFCHCTHKYLGRVTQEILHKATYLVDQYFVENAKDLAQPRLWRFDRFALFGPEKDTPVLERRTTEGMLLELKGQMDAMVPDKWPTYKPHITIPREYEFLKLNMKPVAYALSEGKNELRRWPMGVK